jgi:solute carrier family 7 (cationic amino acid transporter), member 2
VANLSFIVTLCTVIYLIITGIFKADAKNWRIPGEDGYGNGGFFPYGAGGIFRGTATFMFVFIGYESVLSFRTMGKNVQRFTNVSFFVKLLVLLCGIMGVGMILTFMFPYHNTNIVNMPRIFEDFEWYATQWTIAITGIICLAVCTFETIYLLKNLLVVMADDSLVLQSVKVSSTILRTPDFVLFWTIFLIGELVGDLT